jgi:hypothetical protein
VGAVTTLVEGFNKDESNINSLIESIENWVKIFPKKPISPHVLGKISTRFYYAMTSIENQEKSTNLGDMMHRRIVAFLNAILIEEVRENIKSLNKFNNNNPIENDGIFIRNLVSSSIEDLPLSKWLISCPLLLSYINPDFKLTNAISKFTSISNQEIINYSIYELLIKVTVKENQIKKNDKYDGIISKLQKNNVPFNLFQDRLDMSTTMKNNEQIRTKYKQYFGKDKISSTELRNLRRYLNKNDKSW